MPGNAETAARMRAAKGYDGRPKGSRNKVTNDLKKVYLQAFDKLGGLQGLIDWGQKSPDLFYGQISKLLPKGLEIKTDQELTINIISNIPEPKALSAEYARPIDVTPEKPQIPEKTASEDAPESTLSPSPIPKVGRNKAKKRKNVKTPKRQKGVSKASQVSQTDRP